MYYFYQANIANSSIERAKRHFVYVKFSFQRNSFTSPYVHIYQNMLSSM